MKKNVYLFSTSSHPDAISINSLDITFFKPDIDFSKYDYLIVTSKQTAIALKQYPLENYIDKKALCVSKKSAEAFEKLGVNILEIGSGYGDDLCSIIKKYPKNTKWLYLRAEVVANEFVKDLKSDDYDIDEIVLYKSACSKELLNIKVDIDSILIFTSPSSIECYLKNNTLHSTHKVIVIGKTTAKKLPENTQYYISKNNTIESCIELSKQIIS